MRCLGADDVLELDLGELASVRATKKLEDAVAAAQEAGRKYINVASHLLSGEVK